MMVNIFEEGFKELVGKLKRCFTKNGRVANANDSHLNKIRKAMINELNHEDDLEELKAYRKWVEECITSAEDSIKSMNDKDLIDVTRAHIKWVTNFLDKVDKKIRSVEESQ